MQSALEILQLRQPSLPFWIGFGHGGGIDRATVTAQLGAQLQDLIDHAFFFLPTGLQFSQSYLLGL